MAYDALDAARRGLKALRYDLNGTRERVIAVMRDLDRAKLEGRKCVAQTEVDMTLRGINDALDGIEWALKTLAHFEVGAEIQPTGRPEFAGRVLARGTNGYTVRGGWAKAPGQMAWEYEIAYGDAEAYSGKKPFQN